MRDVRSICLQRSHRRGAFTFFADRVRETAKALIECVATDRFQDAIAIHAGELENAKDASFRSQILIKRCKGCGLHWMKFTVSRRERGDWKEISEVGFERFHRATHHDGKPIANRRPLVLMF